MTAAHTGDAEPPAAAPSSQPASSNDPDRPLTLETGTVEEEGFPVKFSSEPVGAASMMAVYTTEAGTLDPEANARAMTVYTAQYQGADPADLTDQTQGSRTQMVQWFGLEPNQFPVQARFETQMRAAQWKVVEKGTVRVSLIVEMSGSDGSGNTESETITATADCVWKETERGGDWLVGEAQMPESDITPEEPGTAAFERAGWTEVAEVPR